MSEAINIQQTPHAIHGIRALEDNIRDIVLERDDEIRSMLLGAVTGQPVLLLGPPGCGKSFQGRVLHASITGAQTFRATVSKATEPERLRGPVDPQEFMKGRYVYNTTGMLPTAHLAIVDEVFKANKAALTELTDILCDRVFVQAGQPVDCPWASMLATSNEMPEDDSLQFLWDRFLLRHWVGGLVSDANRRKALLSDESQITVQHDIAMFSDAAKLVDAAPVDPALIDKLLKIQTVLSQGKTVSVYVSDRRIKRLVKVAHANMVVFGESAEQSVERMIAGLWDTKDQIPTVASVVLKIANPGRAKAVAIMDAMRKTFASFEAACDEHRSKVDASPNERQNLRREILEKLDGLQQTLEAEAEKIRSLRGASTGDIEQAELMIEQAGNLFGETRRYRPTEARSDV